MGKSRLLQECVAEDRVKHKILRIEKPRKEDGQSLLLPTNENLRDIEAINDTYISMCHV